MVRQSLISRLLHRFKAEPEVGRMTASRSSDARSAPASRLPNGPGKGAAVAVKTMTDGGKAKGAENVKPTRLAPEEELSLKLSQGMNSLSGLLTTIDEKLELQNQRAARIAESLDALPRLLGGLAESQKASVDVLRQLKDSVDEGKRSAQQTSEKLTRLPTLIEGVEDRLERQGRSAQAVQRGVEEISTSVRGLTDSAQRSQRLLLDEFRRTTEEQQQGLRRVVAGSRHALIVGSILGIAIVTCLVLLILQ